MGSTQDVRVARAADVPTGSGRVFEVAGRTVAVFNVDGQFHVINNTCVHRGGPLGEGELEANVVTCPWHGWQFNVATGQHQLNPRMCVPMFEAIVDGDDVYVEIPT